MGDRAQVRVVDEYKPEKSVFLYTHWNGHALAETVHAALKRGWRWSDGTYLTRCVFNEMQGEDREETGFGIDTTQHGDIEHPLIILRPGIEPTITIGGYHASFEDFTNNPGDAFKAYENGD